LEVRETPGRGRGVFALVSFTEGEVIESCPVIPIPEDEVDPVGRTVLGNYFFQWGGTFDEGAVALGYGSLYNHTNDPNAMYVRKVSLNVIDFVALRAIAVGEEITVSYHGGFGQKTKVWFEIK
jgi:SET domain-containing protein